MLKKLAVFKCAKCQSVIERVVDGSESFACCGEPMKRLVEGATDGAAEKHVPVIEKIDGGYKVSVGSVAHPMGEDHHIAWIELIADNQSLMAFLKPGDKPEAVFKTDAARVVAREYCNLHGLWKAEN